MTVAEVYHVGFSALEAVTRRSQAVAGADMAAPATAFDFASRGVTQWSTEMAPEAVAHRRDRLCSWRVPHRFIEDLHLNRPRVSGRINDIRD